MGDIREDLDIAEDFDADPCDECGVQIRDGEGYDGLCGNCADRAEAAGRWGP